MPYVGNEASEYGYEDENRSFIQSFLKGEQPEEGFHRRARSDRAADDRLHERGAGKDYRIQTGRAC